MQTRSGVIGPSADRTELHRTGTRIVLSIRGYHDVAAAHAAVARFHECMGEGSDAAIEMVADLRHITGFDEDCRTIWQAGFRKYAARIGVITLVQGTPLAKMAASALGLYLGIQVRSVDRLSDLDPEEFLSPRRPK
jgi:hypothetical protein